MGVDTHWSRQRWVDEMTDPQVARCFIKEMDLDALAVTIDNLHGFFWYEVRIDLDRPSEIHKLVPIPLMPHGASGMPEDHVKGVIGLDVAKINVNAELCRALFGGIKETVSTLPPDNDSISSLLAPATEQRASAAREKTWLFARARADMRPTSSSVHSASWGGRS